MRSCRTARSGKRGLNHMDRDAYIRACKAQGLRVTKAGDVRDVVYSYGKVDNNLVLNDEDQTPYDFIIEDVESVKWSREDKELTLRLIDSSTFVIKGNVPRAEDGTPILDAVAMPASQSELDDVFDLVFPGADEGLYWDVLSEQGMVDPTLFDIDPDLIDGAKEGDGRYVMLCDEIYPFYYDKLERRLREMGFTGRFPSREVRDLVLKKRIFQHKRNLFLEWVQSHKWDGKERMRRWFIEGLGATCNGALSKEDEERYLGDATEAWFLSGIQRMFVEAKSEVVPVLIGGEGIGKGNFLRYTAGYRDEWFIDTSLPLDGPGAEEKLLEGIRGCVIVELSESTQFSTMKGAELLKTFVSKSRDKRRKAYARESTVSIRRFLLVATSNKNNVFLDVGGGNRRYFPMYCNPNLATRAYDPKFKQVGRYDLEQVWAEALSKYNSDPKANTYLSKETAELAAIMQEYGTVENTNVNIIDEWLNDSRNGYTEVGARVCKEMIFEEVLGVSLDGGGVVPTSADMAFTQWADVQKCWRKISRAVSVEGRVTRHAYERIFTAEEIRSKRRSNMVNVVPGHESSFIDVVGIVRKRAQIYGYKNLDDPFPIEGLTAEEVSAILAEGYIYCPDYSKGEFRLVAMP